MKSILSLLLLSLFVVNCDRSSTNVDETPISDPIISQPRFPGNIEGLNRYFKENYRWRQGQLAVAGTVYVQFLVLEDGTATEPKILKGLCETCDAEAIRLVKEMPKWNPAIQDGKPTIEKVILPVKI